jgi:ferritin-like metal-binding protein YciE
MENGMTTPKTYLLEKLYDAYRLERRALKILGAAQKARGACPELRARVREHAVETRWQARLLEICIENLGARPDACRSRGPKLPFSRTASAFKQLEIMTYRAIIAAAGKAGEPEIADICREILDQEISMSSWLEDHLSHPTAATA